jgi:c-di-GMP-binding flagellar brake protein YcgR
MHDKYDLDKRLAMLLRRDDFRLKLFYDFLVMIHFRDYKISAKLLNISSTGASIEYFEKAQSPEVDSEMNLQIHIPKQSEPLSVKTKVVWIRKSTMGTVSPTVTMGLRFMNIDEKTRSRLWDFIVNAETSILT